MKGEIFQMTMGSDESLEDYEESFQLSYKRARCILDPESLKLVLLRGVPEDLLDTFHLLAGGDIYQLVDALKITASTSGITTRSGP